jgi:molybdopterin converting factor small subunit
VPQICVELFGLARSAAGVETVSLDVATIEQAISQLSSKFPELAVTCFQDRRLKSGWLFSVNGRVFTSEPTDALSDGDALLLLSADAGG